MALENLPNTAKDIFENLQDLIKSNLKYYKLYLLKKSAKGTIKLIQTLVLSSVFFFVLIFMSMGAAFWIAEELDSFAAGFFIVGGFYILLMIIAYLLCRTYLEKLVLNKLSKKMYKEKKRTDETV